MIPAPITIPFKYWDEVVSALKNICSKNADVFRNVAHATKVFAKKVNGSGFPVLYRVFYNNQWLKKTGITWIMEVPESEVPEWAKSGVNESEVDVTSRYQRELQLTL